MKFRGKVLVIDDESHVRKFVSLILRSVLSDPTVIEVDNSVDAVEIYQRENPELVLLDVNMPVQDGIETLKALLDADPDCTAVMLSSLATRQTVEQALTLGAAGYLRKDLSKDEIGAALVKILAEKYAEDDGAGEQPSAT
jgi:YesN/AraC family two-component response regulator